jgi:hypothetical protein
MSNVSNSSFPSRWNCSVTVNQNSNFCNCPVVKYVIDSGFNVSYIWPSNDEGPVCFFSSKFNECKPLKPVPSDEITISRIFFSIIFFFLHWYCVYFYWARLKAKQDRGARYLNDRLHFLYILVGCVAMAMYYLYQIVQSSRKIRPAPAYDPLDILMLAVADCAFIMSNASASYRLIVVKFNIAKGIEKATQEKIKRILFVLAGSCGVLALVFLIWYFYIVSAHSMTAEFPSALIISKQDRRIASVLRMTAFFLSTFANSFSYYFVVRNFDGSSSNTENPVTERLSGGKSSDSLTFGRRRRLFVLCSALFNSVFWLLHVFIDLLPSFMASNEFSTSCPEKDRNNDESGCIEHVCKSHWISTSIFVSIYPIAFVIRAFAFPICSMFATRSFEAGAKFRKMDDALHTMRAQVVYKEDGAASYRLGNISTSGPSSRFSADDWHVTAQ